MLEKFYPAEFFEYIPAGLAGLFYEKKPVWEALIKLKDYIDMQSLGSIETEIPPSVHIENSSKVNIGKGCKIYPGAYIEGPCIIGENTEIGHCAYVRAYSLIGNNCKIGHASEVKHSIFLDHAKAPHFNYVGDSILGYAVNLGAGVVCANLKINKTEVMIKDLDQKIYTGMKKLGAIIGDNASLGCNTVTSPGVILKKGFLCYPCSNLHGVFLHNNL